MKVLRMFLETVAYLVAWFVLFTISWAVVIGIGAVLLSVLS